jgi:hypothetical protein
VNSTYRVAEASGSLTMRQPDKERLLLFGVAH